MSYEELTGTKRRIFERAVELFAEKNYEIITMNDIGKAVGIKKPSLYAHFTSKQDILNTIYNFFEEFYPRDRTSLEDIRETIIKGTLANIVDQLVYSFKDEYYHVLINIVKIIENRKYFDQRANQIASMMIDSSMNYVKDALDLAIKMGRIEPINTHTIALIMTYSRTCLFQGMLLSPHRIKEYKKDDDELLKLVVEQLTDLNPPNY